MYNALLFKYKRNNKRLGNSFNEKKKVHHRRGVFKSLYV